jgi:predicted  nucleic acid-binding Zn-ribbon protein
MSENSDQTHSSFTKQGEEAIGKLVEDLLKHPLVSGAVSAALDARGQATRAQELAMSALNLPSATDLEKLTRRVRTVSQRIEGLEDGIDRISERLDGSLQGADVDKRLAALDKRLAAIERALGRLEKKLSQ